jgi:hypothetical protein
MCQLGDAGRVTHRDYFQVGEPGFEQQGQKKYAFRQTFVTPLA